MTDPVTPPHPTVADQLKTIIDRLDQRHIETADRLHALEQSIKAIAQILHSAAQSPTQPTEK